MDSTMFSWRNFLAVLYIQVIVLSSHAASEKLKGIEREVCSYRQGRVLQPVSEHRKRLHALREQMLIRATLQGPEIDAYIVPSYDEHLNDEVAERDRRLSYLTGFTGTKAFAAITLKAAALWTDEKYLRQADGELDCDWEIFNINGAISITDWLKSQLYPEMRVGADPHIVPHRMWMKWEVELNDKFIILAKVNNNLIDFIWGLDRPQSEGITIKVQELRFAGERWQSKITALRGSLVQMHCDAIVVTSLTEIAYILNIRGRDIPYTPVVKGYLVVTQHEIIFYTDKAKITVGIQLHLRAEMCHNSMCVKIKDYNHIWRDLRTYAQLWKRVIVPAPCVFDKGTSEAVYTSIPEKIIYERVSPIVFMKAQKNDVEIEGMKTAHIRDGAAMCEAMSNLEQRFSSEKWTELKIKFEVERSRLAQPHSKGLSVGTAVAFGVHSALPHYANSNITDIEVTDENTLIIESGGQYFDGTTDVSRTFHFGVPTIEQKRAYTSVLAGILKFTYLKFPQDLHPAKIDAVSRSPVWDSMSDYPHATGHGIGSYLSVQEPPIELSYATIDNYTFEEGYFFSNEPGYYKRGSFGIRLENVLEVIDTGKRHSSGAKFYAFREVTLVPYEPKLIDRTLLNPLERRRLNEYNAKIRELVGEELKRQGNMQAFYWMMNKTRHVREFLPEDEYRIANRCSVFLTPTIFVILLTIWHQVNSLLL